MNIDLGPGIALIFADEYGDKKDIMPLILEILRSSSPDVDDLKLIAGMIDPAQKETWHRLELKRRKGNRKQKDDAYWRRVHFVGEIYEKYLEQGFSEKKAATETIKDAELEVKDGGVGKSKPIIRQYLAEYIARQRGEQEAFEAAQPK